MHINFLVGFSLLQDDLFITQRTRFHPLERRFVYLTQRARDTGKLQGHGGNHAGRSRPLRMM